MLAAMGAQAKGGFWILLLCLVALSAASGSTARAGPAASAERPAYSTLIGDVPLEWPGSYAPRRSEAWSCYPGLYFDIATRPQGGPIVAVVDAGIDPAHPDFLNPGASGPDVTQGGQLLLSTARSFVCRRARSERCHG